MKLIIYLCTLVVLFSCSGPAPFDADTYFAQINEAELAICNEQYAEALANYELAFQSISKPFGKDVFNAALASQLSSDYIKRDRFLMQIINNATDLSKVEAVFVAQYLSASEWAQLMSQQELEIDKDLKVEMEAIHDRDQLFRPLYDTHDDTINTNRKINLSRLLALHESGRFPSQFELGYSRNLITQPQDIVFHHTAQRRSYDKSVTDLAPVLRVAIEEGRFDPEQAIFYLHFQSDREKGHFEVYSSWKFEHPLLPDSLNNKLWFPNLNAEERLEADLVRNEWHASSLADITTKTNFLNKSGLPFIFSSVKKSIAKLPEDLDKENAVAQYYGMVAFMMAK